MENKVIFMNIYFQGLVIILLQDNQLSKQFSF